MPSTVVHLALAGLVAAALLGDAFDRRSLLVVFGVTALPDLDAFLALVTTVGHRAALHTLVIPVLAGLVLLWDLRWRDRSFVRGRWGSRGVRVACVALFCYAFVAIGLDFASGVVNPLWPIHDQYYEVQGAFELSSQHGIVQTFVDLGANGTEAETRAAGPSDEVALSTGVNPEPYGEGPADHVVPVVRSTWELVLLLVGTTVTAARFFVDGSAAGEDDD